MKMAVVVEPEVRGKGRVSLDVVNSSTSLTRASVGTVSCRGPGASKDQHDQQTLE